MGRSLRLRLLIAALPLAAACDDTTTLEPGPDEPGVLTVDASAAWAFVRLGSTATEVSPSDPFTSDEWDIAFNATSVMLNGGAAGPAGVLGHCLCQNASATDAAVLAMTPESELPAFLAIGAADVPVDADDWISDALDPAIAGWYAYDPIAHVVTASPERVWKLRAADGSAYAKLHVTAIEDATQQHPGRVTIEYAIQPTAGEPLDAPRTAELDASGGSVYFDLVNGVVSTDAAWDIRIDGYDIRVNGGVSGTGSAGAVRVDEPFDDITDASDLSAGHYRGDAFGGVFPAHPWYRYDLQGNHLIWPTYNVYLLTSGAEVYKVQLIGYYNATGTARHISLRYARIEG